MPSQKRARKRAGRQARLAEVEAARRRQSRLRRGVTFLVIAIVVVGLVALLSRGGSKSSSKAKSAQARSAKSTAAGSTTTTAAPVGASITGPTPCPAPDGTSPRTTSFAQPPPMCIDPAKAYTATFTTDVGTFAVALDAKSAPQDGQ